MLRRLIAPALALDLLPGMGAASEEGAKAPRAMWTAFECGTYAELARKADRASDHYATGLDAGRRFYAALEAGTITDEELSQHAPMILGSLNAGPSVDFILGRVFHYATDAARSDVSQEDQHGLPLPIKDWLLEPELIATKANMLYSAGNCDLL
ncbi:hypothetical protein [Paragemmobacter ruber]|uniref:Uncharacterized protein n=1 Tax=Paragemmobacter ruber TaxID=1985673 RepID=A0ABW9Y0Z2_9RHOB|nr:hypothetical protein [Rhodobacter ruber]NBE06144.1 hypothetical protein [Rhodobacter ruber]